MLAETYEKFKLQLKAQKTGNEQLPEVVQTSDEQVHYICSYNHYPVKDCRGAKDNNDVFAFSRRGLLAYVYSGVSNKE